MDFKVQAIKLTNGAEALSFVPDLNVDQALSIVHTDVLEYLIGLLPEASLKDIKERMIHKINMSKGVKEYMDVLADELKFHASVNVIQQFFIEQEKPKKQTASTSDMIAH